jgi:hypothetical protein
MLAMEAKRTISEVCFGRMVNGLGTEASHRDCDEVMMFSAGEEMV